MASWDVFHADQLELRRGLNAREIREALARGELNEDDLVRPAGSSLPWSRLVDLPDLEDAAPPDAPVAPVHPPAPEAMPPRPLPVPAPPSSSDVAFPVFDQEPEPPNERDRPVGHPSREGDLPRTGRTGHTELEILADEDDLADIPPPPR